MGYNVGLFPQLGMSSSAGLLHPSRRDREARLVIMGLGLFALAAVAFLVGEALLGLIASVVGAVLIALGFRVGRTETR